MSALPVASTFQCPPDCGWCCTHLSRETTREERAGEREFRALMRDLGVYGCTDAPHTGLALSPAEAKGLRDEAARRGLRTRLHPRTWLLETRRRVAVVLEWHLPHEVCPFYEDYKCTAYELRPLVCRAFPVMATPPAWKLAPQCPLTPDTLAKRDAGRVTLGAYLATESRARRAIERRHAALDDGTMRLLDAPGTRFARGLDVAEAKRRLARYRHATPEEFEAACRPRATS